MHRLLKRQLKRYLKLTTTEELDVSWQKFLQAVSDAYQQFDDDHRMLERSMELSSQELFEVNQQMRAAIPDIFLRLDYDGTILDYKPGNATEIYIELPKNAIGKPIQRFLPSKLAQKFEKALKQVHSGESIFSLEHSLTRQGKEHFYEVRLLQLTNQQTIAIIRNITSRKQAEKSLQIAKEEADLANKAKSSFLAKMSHELRTPLNAILGFTQLMTRDDTLSSEQQEYLEIINNSGEHLLSLINDVLDLSKIEAGRIILLEKDFNLHNFLRSLIEMLKVKAMSKNLVLSCDIAENIPQYICSDESKLRQILINLLGNAIKFTNQGVVTLKVTVPQSHLSEDYTHNKIMLLFEVIDTGRGVAEAEINDLFDPFVQSKINQDFQQGTGLGLPIAKQFVELMGGEINVKSQLKKGSNFSFKIPVKVMESNTVLLQNKQSQRVIGLLPNQPSYRILVAEDRPENSRLLRQLLTSVGFVVEVAGNGKIAIELWKKWNPHCIWMDIQMPVMDGYEATRRIRHLEIAKKQAPVPIIALTASALEEERDFVILAGCNDFIRKPFQESIIFEKIAEYLGVKYIYDHPKTAENANDWQEYWEANPDQLKQEFSSLPGDWLEQLHQAVLEADADAILSLLPTIPESHKNLEFIIEKWIMDFQFEELLNVLEQVI